MSRLVMHIISTYLLTMPMISPLPLTLMFAPHTLFFLGSVSVQTSAVAVPSEIARTSTTSTTVTHTSTRRLREHLANTQPRPRRTWSGEQPSLTDKVGRGPEELRLCLIVQPLCTTVITPVAESPSLKHWLGGGKLSEVLPARFMRAGGH